MLTYLTLIFTCQLIGEVIAGALALPVPGPVIGMVLLFGWLALRGAVPDALADTAGGLQKAMSLLFVPAGAGVMLHFHLLGQAILPITAALVISTLLTIAVTGLMMRALSKGSDNG